MRPRGNYLTVRQVAEHLGVSPCTVRNAAATGRIPAIRLGRRGRWWIPAELIVPDILVGSWGWRPNPPLPPRPPKDAEAT